MQDWFDMFWQLMIVGEQLPCFTGMKYSFEKKTFPLKEQTQGQYYLFSWKPTIGYYYFAYLHTRRQNIKQLSYQLITKSIVLEESRMYILIKFAFHILFDSNRTNGSIYLQLDVSCRLRSKDESIAKRMAGVKLQPDQTDRVKWIHLLSHYPGWPDLSRVHLDPIFPFRRVWSRLVGSSRSHR